MPAKHKGKKKKPAKSESESEEEEEEEEEDSEDEGSDKGSDEDEDEEDEEDEDDDDEDEEDDDDDDDDKSDKSGSGSESGSGSDEDEDDEDDDDDDDDDDEDEDDDDSGSDSDKKKKKKKGKGKEKDKGKGKDKKGKKEDPKAKKGKENAIDDLPKPTSALPPQPSLIKPLTISSVADELDDLSEHLARTFPSFKAMTPYQGLRSPPSGYSQNLRSGTTIAPQKLGERSYNFNDDPILKPLRSPTNTISAKLQEENHFTETKGTQCDEIVEKRSFSPEAVRAVQEYKERKEREVYGQTHKDRSAGQSQMIEPLNLNQSNTRQAFPTEYNQKRNYSPSRSGGQFNKSGQQAAEKYYSNLYKKSPGKHSPNSRTMQSLYKNKPQPMFVENDTQPIERYSETGFNPKTTTDSVRKYDQAPRSNDLSRHYNILNANKRQINDAIDVLTRKSRQNSHLKS